jgi:hypothetical protein
MILGMLGPAKAGLTETIIVELMAGFACELPWQTPCGWRHTCFKAQKVQNVIECNSFIVIPVSAPPIIPQICKVKVVESSCLKILLLP